jgi:hypothetical protein
MQNIATTPRDIAGSVDLPFMPRPLSLHGKLRPLH